MPKSRALTQAAFHEVKHNEPKAVTRQRHKKGEKAAHKMEVAIALSKARKAGARIPKK